MLHAFFLKHRDRLFWKGKTSKPRYRLSSGLDEEQSILYLQHTRDGLSADDGTVYFVSKEEAIERLREIHSSPSGVCTVVGINSLVRQFCLRFYCNGIKQLAKEFLKSCPACQLHTSFPTISPPPSPVRSSAPLERIQADIIDMAPGKKGSFMTKNRGQYRYILVIKRLLLEVLVVDTGKNKIGERGALLHNFFFYDEGPPKYLQTDNGTEFINEVVKKLCKSLGIRILYGRPYNPQSQGQVENLNKRVQKKLAKLLCQRPTEEPAKLWPYLLPLVAKEIISTWHHTIQDVPFRVLKGRHTAEFRYPDDEYFFVEVPFVDDGAVRRRLCLLFLRSVTTTI